MICQKCGKPIDEKDNFCQECGAPAIKEEKIENPAPKKRGRPKKIKVVEEETIPNETTPETPAVEETPIIEEAPAIEETPVEVVEEVNSNEEVVPAVEEVICEEKSPKKFSVKKLIFGIIGAFGFTLSLLMFLSALSVLFIDVYNTFHMAFAHANALNVYDPNGAFIISQLYSSDRVINIVLTPAGRGTVGNDTHHRVGHRVPNTSDQHQDTRHFQTQVEDRSIEDRQVSTKYFPKHRR